MNKVYIASVKFGDPDFVEVVLSNGDILSGLTSARISGAVADVSVYTITGMFGRKQEPKG